MSIKDEVMALPWVDTHSHIGCMADFGLFNGSAFRCDCVRGMQVTPPDLWTLLTSPYLVWSLGVNGYGINEHARSSGYAWACDWARANPDDFWRQTYKYYALIEQTGPVKALQRGIRELHACELTFRPDTPFAEINEKILGSYIRDSFYDKVSQAFCKLNVVSSLKLVELCWLTNPPEDERTAKLEEHLVSPVLRVDSFTTLHLPEEKQSFRVKPADLGIAADSFSDYLEQVTDRLEAGLKLGMIGIKNAYAYFGPLQLPPPDDPSAIRYFQEGKPEDYRAFESAVYRHILNWANSHKFPYQFHSGIAAIPNCRPEGLVEQFNAAQDARFVLLHLYPYIREAGCLAWTRHNVYLDPCWMAILQPEALKNAMREWIGFVPPFKMTYGIDATNIEEWYGAAIAAKSVLADVLEEKIRDGIFSYGDALATARAILLESAQNLYNTDFLKVKSN